MNNLTLIKWAGGKGKQLSDLLPLIPQSKVYVEPFGGGASILLNRERSEIEVYNDLDGALINLFSVVRDDEQFERFQYLLSFTPYSRAEYESCLSFEGIADPVKRAVAFYTMINQSMSGMRLAKKSNWARSKEVSNAYQWFQRQHKLVYIHARIQNVQIECRDALDIIQEWDTADTVFYCDPPYILETRSQNKYYAVEPGDEYHNQLIDVLLATKGKVVLSGYDHPIYLRLIDEGWWTDTYGTKAQMENKDAAKGEKRGKRTEIVYRNPAAAVTGVMSPLFLADAAEFHSHSRPQVDGPALK